MAPQNQQRSLLAMLLSGGGRGDPYANQAAGPFASSPRVYGGQSPAAGPPRQAKAAPTPTPRPKQGGGGGGGSKGGGGGGSKKAGGGGQFDLPAAKDATSPSSLMQSPELGATSPSSLMQDPGTPYQQVMPAPPNIGPYPTIASDQTGFPPQPYPTIASDQTGFPPQTYPTVASDQTGFPPRMPVAPPHSQTPPEARLGFGRPNPRATVPGPGMETAMFGQPRDYSRAFKSPPRPFSILDPSTWVGS